MPLNFKKNHMFVKNDTTENNGMSLAKTKDMQKKNTANYISQPPKYTFEDIVLSERQKTELNDVIAFERYKDLLMNTWGLKKFHPGGKGLLVNLYGESGTGKTMCAHAIANELGKNILVVSYSEIESKFVGETAKNLVGLFDFAINNDIVLLFDEADALLSKRVTNMTTSNDVSVNQTKSVLLNILNDFTGVAIFTTNFITNYDHAFLRRISFQVLFEMPDEDQRLALWKQYLSTGVPFNFDIEIIARQYDNLTGSDISSAVWVSAIAAAQRTDKTVSEDIIKKKVESILAVKKIHKGEKNDTTVVSERYVSEEYALEQIKGGAKC